MMSVAQIVFVEAGVGGGGWLNSCTLALGLDTKLQASFDASNANAKRSSNIHTCCRTVAPGHCLQQLARTARIRAMDRKVLRLMEH